MSTSHYVTNVLTKKVKSYRQSNIKQMKLLRTRKNCFEQSKFYDDIPENDRLKIIKISNYSSENDICNKNNTSFTPFNMNNFKFTNGKLFNNNIQWSFVNKLGEGSQGEVTLYGNPQFSLVNHIKSVVNEKVLKNAPPIYYDESNQDIYTSKDIIDIRDIDKMVIDLLHSGVNSDDYNNWLPYYRYFLNSQKLVALKSNFEERSGSGKTKNQILQELKSKRVGGVGPAPPGWGGPGPCPLLPFKILTKHKYLLPYKQGDLTDMMTKLARENIGMHYQDFKSKRLNEKQLVLLFKFLVTTLICIRKHNFYYFDIKPPNIFYQCLGTRIDYYLGDLESFVSGKDFKRGANVPRTLFYMPIGGGRSGRLHVKPQDNPLYADHISVYSIGLTMRQLMDSTMRRSMPKLTSIIKECLRWNRGRPENPNLHQLNDVLDNISKDYHWKYVLMQKITLQYYSDLCNILNHNWIPQFIEMIKYKYPVFLKEHNLPLKRIVDWWINLPKNRNTTLKGEYGLVSPLIRHAIQEDIINKINPKNEDLWKEYKIIKNIFPEEPQKDFIGLLTNISQLKNRNFNWDAALKQKTPFLFIYELEESPRKTTPRVSKNTTPRVSRKTTPKKTTPRVSRRTSKQVTPSNFQREGRTQHISPTLSQKTKTITKLREKVKTLLGRRQAFGKKYAYKRQCSKCKRKFRTIDKRFRCCYQHRKQLKK